MAIATPDIAMVRPAESEIRTVPGTVTDSTGFPGAAPLFLQSEATKAARIDGGANMSKTGTIASYIGFGVKAAQKGEGIAAFRGTLIAGFTGVEPDKEVYLDSTTNTTLTHTSTSNGKAIGHGFTPNIILFY